MTAFLGMRGTGDWTTNERPENWRQGILLHYPNGMAPLTAISSKMSSKATTDPTFHWWTKSLPAQRATVTATYTNSALSSAYTSSGVAGDTLYVKMSEAHVSEFRPGHIALFRYSSDYSVDCAGKVMDVVRNGASSYVAVKLLEDDDNSASYDISDADTLLIVGNSNAEGATMPDAIGYDPTEYYNYTQIFRTAYSLTNTAAATELRTADPLKEQRREKLELHGIEIEKASLWGIRTSGTGANNKPERTTWGLIPVIQSHASGNCDDYRTNTDYSGKTWLQGGEDWLDTMLEVIFRYGDSEKLSLVGSGALLGLQTLIKNIGTFQFTPATKSYGLKVLEWVTPFGMINLITHPLFSHEATNRNSMVIYEPKNLIWRYISGRDTNYKEVDTKAYPHIDAQMGEWLTEGGYEFHHPQDWGYLNGIGQDSTV